MTHQLRSDLFGTTTLKPWVPRMVSFETRPNDKHSVQINAMLKMAFGWRIVDLETQDVLVAGRGNKVTTALPVHYGAEYELHLLGLLEERWIPTFRIGAKVLKNLSVPPIRTHPYLETSLEAIAPALFYLTVQIDDENRVSGDIIVSQADEWRIVTFDEQTILASGSADMMAFSFPGDPKLEYLVQYKNSQDKGWYSTAKCDLRRFRS